ncbi:TetR/AcrR family transcriptional regulator C-terminal domain-containing protein [Clostridium sp.]|uniref:TetR/AcrR family transcriptional regulator C-terminal domain-containing protein n=1 Tax=Clostridium sp. TaxID=1506 RepID=UPI00284D0060|nr:TetR/AcrR family transcriptional regulator C-terminal domain-containing protein [Clostridium sp.]MDR3597518.1 TetR/AcrR family transcriptional regulator C-terminal domain-containing protein [Clostridium sp.]
MNNIIIDETLDLRIRRTHKLLSDALTSLLTEKAFDDIRVSDICNKAMVHRTTFYKHFEDKYQLLDFLLGQIVIEFKEKSMQYTSNINSREYYIILIKLLFEHMYENKKLYSVGLLNNSSARKLLKRTVLECVISSLESNAANGVNFTIPIPIISEFYSAAIVNLASWWLENNMPLSIDDMVKYGDVMINRLDIQNR